MNSRVNFIPDFCGESYCMFLSNVAFGRPLAYDVWMTGRESIGKNYRMDREGYPCYLLTYTFSGKAAMVFDGKETVLSSGDLAFVDCSRPQAFYPTETPWEIGYVHCTGGDLDNFYRRFTSAVGQVLHDFSAEVFGERLNRLHLTVRQMQGAPYPSTSYSTIYDVIDPSVGAEISAALYKLLLDIDGALTGDCASSVLTPAIRFMESNYMRKITLGDIAASAFLSKYYFERVFKAEKNMTPVRYLNRVRFDHAKLLLIYGNMSVLEVAQAVGFSDTQMLGKLFKENLGMTPARFRAEMRKSKS